MKKIIIATLVVLSTFGVAKAQENKTRQYYTFGWNINTPVGEVRNFISPTSLSGFTFNGQIYITDHFGIGFNVAWNNYHEYVDRQTYEISPGFYATASQYRYMNSMPIQVGGYWNFLPKEIVQPYVGFNIGMNYTSQSIYLSSLEYFDNQYAFHLSPEIGAFIRFGEQSPWGANLSVSYQYNTNSFDFNTIGKVNNLQTLTYSIGLTCIID